MPKYIAFLRAINVGSHLVKMAALKACFEELGFSAVETFIASGNVIFDTPAKNKKSLETKIEKHLHAKLGYEVITFLRTPAEVATISTRDPFPGFSNKDTVLFIGFAKQSPSPAATKQLIALSNEVDRYAVKGAEIYWLYNRAAASRYSGSIVEKILKIPVTIRNVTTVKKIAKKV